MQDELLLNGSRLTLEQRKGYLHLSLSGDIATAHDARALGNALERAMERLGVRRLLFDARGLDREIASDPCAEIWVWLSARLYVQMAVVLPASSAELGLTRFNMTGLSSQLPLRGFLNVMDAHRWLDTRMSGERRLSQMGIPAVRASMPPPASAAPAATTDDRVEKKRSGSYHTGDFEPLEPDANGTDSDRHR